MDHLTKIQKAIDYIELHLSSIDDNSLATDRIAREAGFSMWHFQRLFTGVVGDTVKDYVRKRQLTRAVGALGSTDLRIIEIALDHGFESQEAFTRAFKTMFDVNPGECRRQGVKSVLARSKPRITIEYLDHLYGGMTMQPRIVTLAEKKVVGLGAQFISIASPDRNNHLVLPKLWEHYLKRRNEVKCKSGQYDIGLCDAIVEPQLKSHPDEYFYMACVEVESFVDLPFGMLARVVPEGRYAVFTHRGKLDKLTHTMSYIYGSWVPRSGEILREAPDLEIYDDRYNHGQEDSECDIYIPIK